MTRLRREGSEGSEGKVSPLRGKLKKGGAPDGAGWGRLTAAGCVEGLCSLTLKGKVAAPPQFLAPFLRKGVAPQATEDRGVSSFADFRCSSVLRPAPSWGRSLRYRAPVSYSMINILLIGSLRSPPPIRLRRTSPYSGGRINRREAIFS